MKKGGREEGGERREVKRNSAMRGTEQSVREREREKERNV